MKILLIIIWILILILGVRYLFLRNVRNNLKEERDKLYDEKTNRDR